MDKRIKRTIKAIHKGVYELYINTGCKDYSITKLCEKIDINRSTFYLHYNKIEDVIESIQDNILRDIQSILYNSKITLDNVVVACADYIKQHKSKKFDKLFEGYELKLHEVFKNMCGDMILETPLLMNMDEGPHKDYIADFIISGSIGVFRKWIANNCEPDANKLLEGFQKLFE